MFWQRCVRPLLAKVKETTGIVGLEVVPNAREVLISLYTRTLEEIKAVPPEEGYRKAVESFTKHRLGVCQQEEDWEQIEKRIGCGQVEELIEEAQDELKLMAKMIGGLFGLDIAVSSMKTMLPTEWWDIYGDRCPELKREGVDLIYCWLKYCIAEWDPWGVPDDYECEVIENNAPVPKHVPKHKPGPLPKEFYETLELLQSTSNRPPPVATKEHESDASTG